MWIGGKIIPRGAYIKAGFDSTKRQGCGCEVGPATDTATRYEALVIRLGGAALLTAASRAAEGARPCPRGGTSADGPPRRQWLSGDNGARALCRGHLRPGDPSP